MSHVANVLRGHEKTEAALRERIAELEAERDEARDLADKRLDLMWEDEPRMALEAAEARIKELEMAVAMAYGNLWRILTPGAAETMARKALLAVMTTKQIQAAIAEHGQPLQGSISAL